MKVGNGAIILKRGDITTEAVDAIVNAANSSLMGGGGVDGAIHRVGGPQLLDQCRKVRSEQGECPPGQAVITGGGRLKARYVIHAVGPVWHGGGYRERETLESAYFSSLTLAQENGISSIAFPSISTGAYRFPIAEAAKIALSACAAFLKENQDHPKEIRFVLYSDADLQVYEEALQALGGE